MGLRGEDEGRDGRKDDGIRDCGWPMGNDTELKWDSTKLLGVARIGSAVREE